MDPNVKPQTLVETLNQPTLILSQSICNSRKFVALSCDDMHSSA